MKKKKSDQNNKKIVSVSELLKKIKEFATNLRDKLNKQLES